MTSSRPDERFWAMFEPTPTWPNFHFGQLCMWMWVNNDQIWLPRGQMSAFEKCLNLLPTWPDFTFGQLVRWIGANNAQIWLYRGYKSDFEQCSNWLQLDLILLLVNFWYKLSQMMTRYVFLDARFVILRNVLTDSQLTYFYFW